jgi:hypothetical protein
MGNPDLQRACQALIRRDLQHPVIWAFGHSDLMSPRRLFDRGFGFATANLRFWNSDLTGSVENRRSAAYDVARIC